ncbi:MAG: hypothetical protein ABSB36_09640 [Candidatus Dormibacteria bacterium]
MDAEITKMLAAAAGKWTMSTATNAEAKTASNNTTTVAQGRQDEPSRQWRR